MQLCQTAIIWNPEIVIFHFHMWEPGLKYNLQTQQLMKQFLCSAFLRSSWCLPELLESGDFWQVTSKLSLPNIHLLRWWPEVIWPKKCWRSCCFAVSLLDASSFRRRMQLSEPWGGKDAWDLSLNLGHAAELCHPVKKLWDKVNRLHSISFYE